MDKELRILLVEDVPADAELEVRELKRAGLRVTHQLVETEEAFRSALKEYLPEIILSDFSMPHFDGMFALALARELAPDVPFIFVSGTIGEEYAIRALKNGATDYVLKNNLVRLPAAVERALQDAKARVARRRAERDQSRLAAIVENSNDAIISRDLDHKVTSWNAAAERMFGYTAAEVIGRDSSLIVPPDREAEVAVNRSRLMQGYPVPSYDSVRLTQDGRKIDVSVSQSPIKDASARIIGLSLVFHNISERKSHELKIARLSRIHEVLSGINSAIVRIRDRQQLFEEACRIAVEHGKFTMSWIGMLDEAAQVVRPVARMGRDEGYLERLNLTLAPDNTGNLAMVVEALGSRAPVVCNDIATDGRMRPWRAATLERGYRSAGIFPLMLEQRAVGVFVLYAPGPGFFDEEEVKLLTELAGDISFALEHIAKEEKLAKLSRIRMVSSEINAAIVRIREQETLLREVCRIAAEHGKFELVWIGTIDHEKQEVRPVAWTGFSEETAHAVNWASISTSKGTLGEAIQTRKPSVRNDIEAELPGGKLRQEALKQGCRSTVCLPFVVDDKVVAAISLFAAGRGFFDEDELALLNELAADVSFALQSISRQEKVEYLSYFDPLTGLPNRALFLDRLSQQLRARSGEPRMVALILLDIERLRNINETLGRHGGDMLLRLVARRLEHCFNGPDYIARIGADNFGVVIPGVRDAMEIAHATEGQVLACFREPFLVNDKELRVAVKTGIAVFPTDGGDADTLFKNAEAALRKAKDTGERFLFYRAEMNAQAAQSLSLETRLRKAVEAQQFVLHYQPKVDLASGRLCGLEALIRWQDPVSGLVPPGAFIPLLEETGLILEVGRWALAQALAQHREWTARGCIVPRIAVNVSAIQLQQKDYADSVVETVRRGGNVPEAIELEITESLLMKDVEASIRTLSILRGLGIHIALDDFGTGYSSLSYITRLPISSVKIDRSFINGMVGGGDDTTIVSTIIVLAHSLNLRVVAEGVETEEQAQLLRLLKCDEMQGYLFSRPLPAAEVEAKYLAAAAA